MKIDPLVEFDSKWVKRIYIMLEWVRNKFSEISQFLTSLNTRQNFGKIPKYFRRSTFWSRMTPNGVKRTHIKLEPDKNKFLESSHFLTSLTTGKNFEKIPKI